MTEPIIQADHLTKTYGRGPHMIEAVRGIDLQVRRGEIFGLVGPDGAGKTTIIQMLCGLITPKKGNIQIAGIDVLANPPGLGGLIGYMSEGFTLYGDLSVEENMDFFAQLYRVPAEVAAARKDQLLRFARLEAARGRRAKNLSGGMKKKLALACTLIYRPQVLFLDEPTTGVDPVSRQDFWKILYEFLAEGITIFVSTPFMDEAERCQRVALLRGGEIIANDAPATLKESIQGVAVEMIAQPQPEAVAFIRQMPSVSQVQVFGERLHVLVRNGQEVVDEVVNGLKARGVTVSNLTTTSSSLEDVFIAALQDEREAAATPKAQDTPFKKTPDSYPPAVGGLAVQVDSLTRRFGSFTAVDGINLEVTRGEIFGFLGPNGSGKTTTIRMLCGLLSPSGGSARVLGFDVQRQRTALKAQIGYMSQKFSLYKDLTVGENIRFYGDLYNLPPARLAERRAWVLAMAGLTGKEGLLTRDLSGGWKQRLALGCAVLHEPQVLFLDEPTSGVDPVSRREFWNLVFALSVQGVTIFITTHYMDEAEHCHKLALLYRGRVIARGSPADLRANMKLGSLLEVPVRDPLGALVILAESREIIQSSVFGDRLHALVWDPDLGAELIQQALTPLDLLAGPIQPVPVSLEDLFNLFIEMDESGQAARQIGGNP